jgi:mono/diheme cytochrome c family protein
LNPLKDAMRVLARPGVSHRFPRFAGAIGAVVCAAVLVAWLFWPSFETNLADPDNRRQVSLGEAVYRQHCASCHGVKLEGQPNWRERKADGRLPAPPHDERGHTWHHSDAQLFGLTKHGLKPPLGPPGYESDMPAFDATLNDEQIWAVIAFIKSRWPSQIRDHQSRIDETMRRAR